MPPTQVDDGRRPRDRASTWPSAASGIEAFRIHLRGTGTFRPVSPVVFVMLAEGIASCEQLAASVRRGPLEVDLAYPYHPHVTVAHHLGDDSLDQAFGDLASFECAFEVDRLLALRPRRGRGMGTDAGLRVGCRLRRVEDLPWVP